MLLPLDPVPVVGLLVFVGEPAPPVLYIPDILPGVLGPITPGVGAVAMEVAGLPVALVPVLVGVGHQPVALGQKGLEVDASLVVLLVGIVDGGFLLGVVVDEDSAEKFLGLGVVPPEGALLGFGVEDGPVEVEEPVVLGEDPLPLDGSLVHLALKGDALVVEDGPAPPVGLALEVAAVGILVGDDDVALALHLAVLPVPQVVLLPVLVPDPLEIVGVAEVVEVWIALRLLLDPLKSWKESSALLMSEGVVTASKESCCDRALISVMLPSFMSDSLHT